MTLLRTFILAVMIATFAPAISAQTTSETAGNQTDISQVIAVADQFDQGVGVPINFVEASKLYLQAAQAGNAHAQYKLGTYFRKGMGVEPDLGRSFDLLVSAAKSNQPDHLFALAQMYEHGVGTQQDLAQAIKLYTQAADAGSSDAHVNIGVIYQSGSFGEPNPERAYVHFQNAADAKNPRGQNNLGLLYSRGEGVAQDYDKAFALFKDAANAGLAKAMKNLGVMYENGFGTVFDEDVAHELYRRAGRSVQDNLKQTIADLGILADPRIATATGSDVTELRAAARAGDIVAQYILSQMLLVAPRPNAFITETAAYTTRAAQNGFINAKANLGVLYILGYGVPQDYVLAYAWIAQARANGISKLDPLFEVLSSMMTRGQVAKAQSIAAKQWKSSLN